MRRPVTLLLLLCTGCTWFKTNPNVLISSDPAGAHIWIDGHDSGETTPHAFVMADNFAGDHDLELRRQGYRPERRHLTQFTRTYSTRFYDGGSEVDLPPLPIFWTTGDFYTPFGVQGSIIPSELFIKMYREDEPLLGFDVLAARLQAGQTAK